MKKQDIMTPSNVNTTTVSDPEDSDDEQSPQN
jgi:hypothetical protein